MVTDDNHEKAVGLSPICDEKEFVELMTGMVADEAPRLFALVQELGERADGRIAAWGLAFEDGPAEIVGVVPGTRMTLRSPESAVRRFSGEHVRTRLVWV